jgi:hypothetical protein
MDYGKADFTTGAEVLARAIIGYCPELAEF